MRLSSVAIGIACAVIMSTASIAQVRDARNPRSGPSANQIIDQFDAEIARLKANLRLTPEQDKNWSSFQAALHDIAAARAEARINRPQETARDINAADSKDDGAIAALRAQADEYAEKSTNLKKLADAVQPLYGSLDDRQRTMTMRFLNRDWAAMYPNNGWDSRGRR
jgi:hypothetical protein